MVAAQPPGARLAPADEFAVRYYRWALDDIRREVRESFPLLRSIKSSLPMRAVAFLESFSDDDRLRAATALVKRFHPRAIELTGDSFGAAEREVDEGYRDAMRIARPEEEWYRQAMLNDSARLRIDRRRFLAAVKAELAPVLGAGEPFSSTREWRYDTSLGPWMLTTLVDVGGSVHQLMYTQTIVHSRASAGGAPAPRRPAARTAGAATRRPLKEGLSACAWLGIAGQTDWNRLVESDTPAAARSLARVCAHFLEALPALLAGLSPE